MCQRDEQNFSTPKSCASQKYIPFNLLQGLWGFFVMSLSVVAPLVVFMIYNEICIYISINILYESPWCNATTIRWYIWESHPQLFQKGKNETTWNATEIAAGPVLKCLSWIVPSRFQVQEVLEGTNSFRVVTSFGNALLKMMMKLMMLMMIIIIMMMISRLWPVVSFDCFFLVVCVCLKLGELAAWTFLERQTWTWCQCNCKERGSLWHRSIDVLWHLEEVWRYSRQMIALFLLFSIHISIVFVSNIIIQPSRVYTYIQIHVYLIIYIYNYIWFILHKLCIFMIQYTYVYIYTYPHSRPISCLPLPWDGSYSCRLFSRILTLIIDQPLGWLRIFQWDKTW